MRLKCALGGLAAAATLFSAPMLAAWPHADGDYFLELPGCGTEIWGLGLDLSQRRGDGLVLLTPTLVNAERFDWMSAGFGSCEFLPQADAVGNQGTTAIPGPGAAVVLGLGLLFAARRTR